MSIDNKSDLIKRLDDIAQKANAAFKQFETSFKNELPEEVKKNLNLLQQFSQYNSEIKSKQFCDRWDSDKNETKRQHIIVAKILKDSDAEVERLIKNLKKEVERTNSEEYRVAKYKNLIKTINAIKEPACQNTGNLTTEIAHLMQAYNNMKSLIHPDKTGRMIDRVSLQEAIDMLELSYENYQKYQQNYNNIQKKNQETKNSLTQIGNNLDNSLTNLETLKNLFFSKSNEVPHINNLVNIIIKKRKEITELIAKSVDKATLEKLIAENEGIKESIGQITTKHKSELQKIKNKVQAQLHLIDQLLDKIKQSIHQYSAHLTDKENQKYNDFLNKKNKIINKYNTSTSLKSAHDNIKEAEALETEIITWKDVVENTILDNLRKRHAELKKKIKNKIQQMKTNIDQVRYADLHQLIDNITSLNPCSEKKSPIEYHTDHIDFLNRSERELKNIQNIYIEVSALIQSGIECFSADKGKEFFTTYLNDREHAPSTHMSYILDKIGAAGYFDRMATTLNQFTSSELFSFDVEKISTFINRHSNDFQKKSMQINTLKEKLTCYELLNGLQERKNYIADIDNSPFREAFLFLKDNGIAPQEAAQLAQNQKTRSIALDIKLTSPNIESEITQKIFSSDTTTQAVFAIFNDLQGIDKNDPLNKETYTCLVKSIANTDGLDQAIIEIKNNKQLFTPLFLLGLSPDGTSTQDIENKRKCLIDALSHKETTAHYQKVWNYYMQLWSYYQQNFDNLQSDAKINLLESNLSKDNVYILGKIFEELDGFFDELIKNKYAEEKALQKTKMEIFNLFKKLPWEVAAEKSTEIIQENFKDDRSLLEKITDRLAAIWTAIKNLFKQEEEPQQIRVNPNAFAADIKIKLNTAKKDHADELNKAISIECLIMS